MNKILVEHNKGMTEDFSDRFFLTRCTNDCPRCAQDKIVELIQQKQEEAIKKYCGDVQDFCKELLKEVGAE